MKALFLTMTLLATSLIAKADGFVCTSESGLNVKVYNHTSAAEGTRTAAIMVVSDSMNEGGDKTIASFKDAKSTLSSGEETFEGKVDLRVSESNQKEKAIAGTTLGELAKIILSVDFSYNQPQASGDDVAGQLTLVLRNGSVMTESANCVRYLKN